MDTQIRFTLNGQSRTISTDPGRPLLEVLREDFQLTGAKFGCGEGECRACTVLLNGKSTPSCSVPIAAVDKHTVLTIEGLAHGEALHPIQEAFLQQGAFQCGYCTAGMIMGATAVMQKNPQATEAEVMAELEKHICRCGSYAKYREAVRRVVMAAQTGKVRA